MQIVIEIPKYIVELVKNSIPLPEGHGRLIDADAFENMLLDAELVGATTCYDSVKEMLEYSPTILKTDER